MAAFSISHGGHTSTRNLSPEQAGIAWQAANDTLTLLGHELGYTRDSGDSTLYAYWPSPRDAELVRVTVPHAPRKRKG